ncbi:PolC-type DNA polymerase III [Papillibacter cinnamivorans]|uniref:DNA polymerase III PolC-type n=1 Tax=Papillibacter cinnamivorans DSM 12816 TaxID=1122930 RepID=A0A1W1YLP3_9FIRM|nr:PolC-type DNA polymerase III [Papillibacter cinnamivorans]SMC37097.1 DNA polymerase-3 subunit alpha [Papillibacter cinnamivorans DSM 12816]
MNKPVPFFELLSGYRPGTDIEGAFGRAVVTSMSIMRETRAVELELEAPEPLPPELLRRAEEELAAAYLAESVHIRVINPEKSFGEEAFALLESRLKEEFPPAAGLLPGAVWQREEGRLTLRLKTGGAELLAPYAPFLEELVFSAFGNRCRVFFEDDAREEELLQYTESIRSEAMKNVPAPAAAKGKKKAPERKTALYGRVDKSPPVPVGSLTLESGTVTVRGCVFSVAHREIKKRGAWVVCFDLTDYTGSIRVSRFLPGEEAKPLLEGIRQGDTLTVRGHVGFNRYDNDLVLEPVGVALSQPVLRADNAGEKRVELHAHTRMSSMDAVTDTGDLVAAAARWGHRAIAITDHGVAQAYPDAMKAGKANKIKILYGLEAYFVNDVDDKLALRGNSDASFDDEIVAFDIETTGLDSRTELITEIGAVVLKNGTVTDRFRTFVNPGRRLTPQIVELTGITDAMLKGAPSQEEALRAFLDFAAGRPLAAHNAEFDVGFISRGCRRAGIEFQPVYIDTLVLAQNLLPELPRHKLDVVASFLELPSFQHHRAEDDANMVALMLIPFFRMLRERGASRLGEINRIMAGLKTGGRSARSTRHLTILVKNQTGLRNLYKLISLAHLEHFKKVPIVPKSLLLQCREGLILGSACEAGEVFSAVAAGKDWEELRRLAGFYDFLEIQPLCNNEFMLYNGRARSREDLMDFNRAMVALGQELKIPVCATGDVHFLEPEHETYRRILLAAKQFPDADRPLPLYFKTTEEMLEEFSYLGEEKAFEVVVTNTNLVADLCEDVRPLPVGLFAPKLDGSREELESLVWGRARALYGEELPPQVADRLGEEMQDIIGRGYDVIYMSAQKLVSKSLEDGYLVGSRGSVGSSLAAYMAGITEVNPLPPHYRCPKCHTSEFDVDPLYGCGADMPDKLCPVCGARYEKDGFSIPFATFLGFGGDKIPDIDLNFSGEYQAKAHRHTFVLFGEEHVFRAGTIGTLKEKTAFGFVKKYLEERGQTVTRAEENRLTLGCVGVKRTTGQHPGGLVVIPGDREIYDFCPVQHPADDMDTDIVITHFEYHSMESNLLKLDMLGHDDPTMIRMLEDLTGVNARKIPLDDPETVSLYTSSKALGFENDAVLGPTGACALPEFGTKFVREMLLDTLPDKFDTLVRIAGFSHGTDVWLGNARDLITSGTASVTQVIGARDDIMLYLISVGMPEKLSFKIMEAVRKGKGLTPEWEEQMRAHGVPAWYIESCNKIKYLFPKAHAVAYVMMSFRIAWFKVHKPLAFYAAYFSIRAKAFDASVMTGGLQQVLAKMKEIEASKEPTAVEEDMLVTLEVCYEFYLRGFHFEPIDLYKSDPVRFLIEGDGLLPPFVSISGLGETAARSIAAERRGRTFISVEEFSAACPKVSKTHIEQLRSLGVLSDLPQTSQLTLFD